MAKSKKVVLAYSGGLDTSVIVKWLALRGWEVAACLVDVGQPGDLKSLADRARGAGASKVVIKDLKRAFVKEFCFPSLKANALYEGVYPLATALARPLIAKALVDVAKQWGAKAVAHGCTGKGNDQVRFEVGIRTLGKGFEIVAPVREWEFKTREQEIEFAKVQKIPLDITKKSPYSIDENLWGVAIECGILENPWVAPPEEAFLWTRSPEDAPNRPQEISIGFSKGVPVSLDGKKEDSVNLVQTLNKLGAKHGIGRMDLVESRLVGIKSREIYEAPGATILLEAHQDLERLVLDRELLHFKQGLSVKYGELVYYGLWYSPLREALDAFVERSQENVTGVVRVRLYRGKVQVVGRQSPHSLYKEALATYGEGDVFDQKLADGFVRLWGLPYEQ
ncbi:MAG: argininosuccinate synthase [Candidatus Omnitrophica bacterium]|nr:argininosuccinate synthase [Candidatus Omnitrophota bacterium]